MEPRALLAEDATVLMIAEVASLVLLDLESACAEANMDSRWAERG